MDAKKTQNIETIIPLKGPDRVRKRPRVIFDSDGAQGCLNALRMLVENAVVEALLGFGTEICVSHFADGSLEVADCGRGIPVTYNEAEGKFDWEINFCELYARPRDYKPEKIGEYDSPKGGFGIELCAVQYASAYMDAEIRRDGYCYKLHFEKGYPVGELRQEPCEGHLSGSKIRFKPDAEVFGETKLTNEAVCGLLKECAQKHPHIRFLFKHAVAPESIIVIS